MYKPAEPQQDSCFDREPPSVERKCTVLTAMLPESPWVCSSRDICARDGRQMALLKQEKESSRVVEF